MIVVKMLVVVKMIFLLFIISLYHGCICFEDTTALSSGQPESFSVKEAGMTSANCLNETCGCSYDPAGPLVRCDYL